MDIRPHVAQRTAGPSHGRLVKKRSHMMSSQDASAEAAHRLREWVNGFRITQLIAVAARLQLADLLQDGPKTRAELAAVTGANADALVRLLRTLVSLGVFSEPAPNQFA